MVVLAEGEVVSSGPVRRVVAESPAFFAPQVTKVLGAPWLRVDEVVVALGARHEPALGPPRRPPLRVRSAVVLGVASVAGLMMFGRPLLVQSRSRPTWTRRSSSCCCSRS